MGFVGIDAITYGVRDLDEADRFLEDWGLGRGRKTDGGLVFEPQDGSQVVVRAADDPALPPPISEGPGLREIAWGVEDARQLSLLAEKLRRHGPVENGEDGTVRVTDPMGLRLVFRRSRTRRLKEGAERAAINTVTRNERINERAPQYGRARPISIGHVVFLVPDLAKMEEFYTDLGFWVSDRYRLDGKPRAVFLRCKGTGPHHNLFMIKSPTGEAKLHHVAFKVRDVHEIFAGGIAMSRKGWPTEIGPGRHTVSSAYFWYFKNPCGGAIEYFTDEDFVTPEWRPKNFDSTPENFAEWVLPQGLQLTGEDVKNRC
jgi:catechol 2,3-dioxygenase-like lactoylglutathione lyase family enzyme